MPHVAKTEFFDMGIWDDLDITGWNYLGSHEKARAKYPGKPIVYSESASAGSTYGFYSGPATTPYGYKKGEEFAAKQMDSYDLGTTIDIADLEFNRMEKSPWCAGEFVWTGIDYLGEPIPFRADARSSYFGIADLTGIPKDRYWLYRANWNDKSETIHILPHWNWGNGERVVPVFVYTSGDEAELFINGKSQGMRRKGECALPGGRTNGCYSVCGKYRLMWFDTVYEPGEVKAVAYRNGVRIGEAVVRTAGKPVALKLTQDYCDGELCFVQIDAVDASGVRDPLATNRVSLSVCGPGRIVAVGNGNPREMESFADPSAHSLFFGKAVAVVRREGEGRIVLTASADGMESAETTVDVSAKLHVAKAAHDAFVSQPCESGALQSAIDDVSESGGGTVHVAPGDYPVAFLELKSGVTLDLAEGARLFAETNALVSRAQHSVHEHDQDNALILSRGAKDIAIVGRGEIDGLGETFRPTSNNLPGRWKLLVFQDSEGIRIEGVTLRDSASWTCFFQRCRGITVRGVKVDGHANYNNDGFDIEASDVLIEDCDIDCEDDAICGKIHDPAFVCENVEVRNCRLASNCNFIKLGTASYGAFRNWRVHDCVLERCRAAPLEELQWYKRGVWGVTDKISGISGVCLEAVDGGTIEDVVVSDIDMRSGVQTPIFLRVGARHGEDREWNFRNVTIERVKGVACSWIANSITGVPGRRIGGGITLRDIDLVMKGGISGVDWKRPVPEKEKSYPENRCFVTPLPAYGFYLRHADGLEFENVRLSVSGGQEHRRPIVADDCTDVNFTNCAFQEFGAAFVSP
jgi:polygalacturonase